MNNSQSHIELEAAARKFLALIQAQAPRPPTPRTKNDPWPETLCRYTLRATKSPHWPFVLSLGPGYKYLCANGDMFAFVKGAKVRTGFFGNIFALTTQEAVAQYFEWRKASGDATCGWYLRAGLQKCGICMRTKGVRETVLGYRCQYCRTSDSRHMGLIRRLGHRPLHNGRPIANYLVD